MVMAGKTLFVAGPPDVVDEEIALKRQKTDPAVLAKLAKQVEAFQGRLGGVLWVVSTDDGKKLAEYKIESPPVFDGMAAAEGSIFFSTLDGSVVRMSGVKQ